MATYLQDPALTLRDKYLAQTEEATWRSSETFQSSPVAMTPYPDIWLS